MATERAEAGKPSGVLRRSVSESNDDSNSSGEEDEEDATASTSNLSSSDVGTSPNVSLESDESPVVVAPRARRGVASKPAAGHPPSCWHDDVDAGDTHTVTHHHSQTLIRRPLHGHGSAKMKDSYIECTSQYTVSSKRHSDGINWNLLLAVSVALVCAVCLVSVALGFFAQPAILKSTAGHGKSAITPEMFLHVFNGVKESFPVQTSGFWGIIRAAIKPIVLQDDPSQPAVFVLVVPSDTHETASCFVRVFSDRITSLLQAKSPVEFFTDTVASLPPERVKRLLDDRFRNGLVSGSRIAIIRHLEQLHGDSAMMLHAYCDNENAPFRRAIFVLVLFVDETSAEVTETDSFVEERLEVLWGDTLGTNKFYPLITRIAHSIAFMRPETSDVLANVNC